ncbi:MAG: hypothetical protein GY757_43910, partial [bacterium]|nr:hypothetical protein [bacterium]
MRNKRNNIIRNNIVNKAVYLIFILFIGLFAVTTQATNNCDVPDPSEPGGDHADDNFSFSSSLQTHIPETSDFKTAECLIVARGYYSNAVSMLDKMGVKWALLGENQSLLDIREAPKVVLIPSGGLFGMENNLVFKQMLSQYVLSGGNVIVMAQQYGAHFDNVLPLPEDQHLKSYGWREDQSCFTHSTFFQQMHPVLSSLTNQRITAGVDGYIATYPANSTILLKRRINFSPVLLYYPFGTGKVFVTSLFSDWAYGHSQSTASELRIFRDLVSFAQNSDLPVPMYTYTQYSNPDISLDVNVKNISMVSASKIKLTVYHPDRNTVVYETEHNGVLSPQSQLTIPVNFKISRHLNMADHGIYNVVYELLDDNNQPVQPKSFSDSGRFAIYKVTNTYNPHPTYSIWITSAKDFYYWKEQADVVLHIKNYSDEPITLDWYYDFTHQGHYSLPSLTIPANDELHYPVKLDFPHRNSRRTILEMLWVWHRIAENTAYRRSYKGLRVKYPMLLNTRLNVQPSAIGIGAPIPYNFSTRNGLNTTMENVELKVFLQKRLFPLNEYETIATVYNNTVNIDAWRQFSHSGSYDHSEKLPIGMYRLKLDILRPDGTSHTVATN